MLRLKYERRRRGWNQTTLAARARLSQGVVSLIETGRLRPTETHLRRLAQALKVQPPRELLVETPLRGVQ